MKLTKELELDILSKGSTLSIMQEWCLYSLTTGQGYHKSYLRDCFTYLYKKHNRPMTKGQIENGLAYVFDKCFRKDRGTPFGMRTYIMSTVLHQSKPMITMGDGDCGVSVWSLPKYIKHPNTKGDYHICISKTDFSNALDQYSLFCLPEAPKYLIFFRFGDEGEKNAFGNMLSSILYKFKAPFGNDWYITNKETMCDIYNKYWLMPDEKNNTSK